jgi:hypothetical protein
MLYLLWTYDVDGLLRVGRTDPEPELAAVVARVVGVRRKLGVELQGNAPGVGELAFGIADVLPRGA